MKLTFACLLFGETAVHGFTPPSPFAIQTHLNAASDYSSLMDKLNDHLSDATTVTSSLSSSVPSSQTIPDETQAKLLNVLSSTLEAANNALVASAEVSKISLASSTAAVNNADSVARLSTFITDAQAQLMEIEHHLYEIRTGPSQTSEVDTTLLLASLNQVLDTSLQAAQMAAHSSSDIVDSLTSFNLALSHSMSNAVMMGNMVHPEMILDTMRVQLAALLNDAKGMPMFDTTHWNINDAGMMNLLSALDEKIDRLSFGVTSEATVLCVCYGLVAYLMGYAQNTNVGVDEYKRILCRRMEEEKFDIDEFAKEIGYVKPKQLATTPTPPLTSVDYDAAARLAYQSSGKTMNFDTFKSKYLLETSEMVAKKNPYIPTSSQPAPPNEEISTESIMKQPMVVKDPPVKRIVKVKPNLPPASPLARLLAEELGLELKAIGRGSGKNGKILIEDVRLFQSKLEKKVMRKKEKPYFATATAG